MKSRPAKERIWEALTPADRLRSGVHEARGEETLELMLRITAGHDLCHLAQMTRCLEVIEKRGQSSSFKLQRFAPAQGRRTLRRGLPERGY